MRRKFFNTNGFLEPAAYAQRWNVVRIYTKLARNSQEQDNFNRDVRHDPYPPRLDGHHPPAYPAMGGPSAGAKGSAQTTSFASSAVGKVTSPVAVHTHKPSKETLLSVFASMAGLHSLASVNQQIPYSALCYLFCSCDTTFRLVLHVTFSITDHCV
jgi:hypothetical protein